MAASDADLWKIFANKVKATYLMGQDVGTKNRIYIPLLNERTIPAGFNVNSAITNFGIRKAGDALIDVDNPLYVRSNDGYAQKCLEYMRCVELNADSSIGLKQVLEQKKKDMDQAEKDFLDTKIRARKAWKDSGETSSFLDFALENTSYGAAQSYKDQTASAYAQLLVQVYGPGASSLTQAISKVERALSQDESVYNMLVSSALLNTPAETQAPERAPKYVIDANYSTVIQNWISTASDPSNRDGNKFTIKFDSTEAGNYNWESIGHSSDKINASVGFLPFFQVNYSYENSKKTEDIKASDFKTKVTFELRANGASTFPIGPDPAWNPGNVKKTYPKLRPGSAPYLSEPMVQVTNVIVGYNVSLKITMGKDTYDRVNSLVETATKHDGGASATLFGFRLDLGASGSHEESNSTKWSDVKQSSGNYEMVLPASNDSTPVLLAVIGSVFGKD